MSRLDGEIVRCIRDDPHDQHVFTAYNGARLICPGKCPECDGVLMDGPDHEGFMDCRDCGAAWQPQFEQPL